MLLTSLFITITPLICYFKLVLHIPRIAKTHEGGERELEKNPKKVTAAILRFVHQENWLNQQNGAQRERQKIHLNYSLLRPKLMSCYKGFFSHLNVAEDKGERLIEQHLQQKFCH